MRACERLVLFVGRWRVGDVGCVFVVDVELKAVFIVGPCAFCTVIEQATALQ
jgi:hypothetical protein